MRHITFYEDSNEYISVKRLDSSNKWLGVPHASEMEKMWSIIVDLKKEIRTLPKYRELSRVIDIRLTPVKKVNWLVVMISAFME